MSNEEKLGNTGQHVSKQVKLDIEEVHMNRKCHKKRSFLSVALGLHRNYLYKEVQQRETSCSVTILVHRHFL